ncbi:cytochrome b5, partial [Teratosphaeria nubilosa]
PAVPRGPPPSAASALRVPSTGPLPNRGPPANSQQRANGGLSPNGTVSTPNARGKVLLKPGHSPMDWAALTRSGNLSGVPTFQRVTPSRLKTMTGRKGKPAWSSWQGKVYNITPYLPFHPGGEAELLKAAGRDGTKLFMDVHPWVNWDNMLEKCLLGAMVPEETSSLDDMD